MHNIFYFLILMLVLSLATLRGLHGTRSWDALFKDYLPQLSFPFLKHFKNLAIQFKPLDKIPFVWNHTIHYLEENETVKVCGKLMTDEELKRLQKSYRSLHLRCTKKEITLVAHCEPIPLKNRTFLVPTTLDLCIFFSQYYFQFYIIWNLYGIWVLYIVDYDSWDLNEAKKLYQPYLRRVVSEWTWFTEGI